MQHRLRVYLLLNAAQAAPAREALGGPGFPTARPLGVLSSLLRSQHPISLLKSARIITRRSPGMHTARSRERNSNRVSILGTGLTPLKPGVTQKRSIPAQVWYAMKCKPRMIRSDVGGR